MKNTPQAFLGRIQSLSTLKEADDFTSQAGMTETLVDQVVDLFGKNASSRKDCTRAIRQLKERIHPLTHNEESARLLDLHDTAQTKEEKAELQARYVVLGQTVANSDEGKLYQKISGILDRAAAPLLALDHGSGRSNRAKRAKTASNVFTKNAGLSKATAIDGVDEDGNVDQHGNMIGSDWDLGRNGAYDGLKVLILQEYWEGNFTGEYPISALREKGFEVVHCKVRNPAEAKALDSTLEAELQTASQIWLIAHSMCILADSQLDLIVEHWTQGLGVYIFGDNDPFFVDANRLLRKLSPLMRKGGAGTVTKGDPILALKGNTTGDQVVGARQNAGGPGFVPGHLLVTGLSQLYEGVTVSSLQGEDAAQMGFEEVLREHTGPLVVAARPALDGSGPIIVDGAFTKLYCHWGRGGSARFVRNCACWLSTLNETEELQLIQDAKEVEAQEGPTLNTKGAFVADCTISLEEGTCALLATTLSDPDQNTTDFALDNNLGMGRKNLVLGSEPLNLNVAKLFLEQGKNPFTWQPVVAIVPLVSLEDAGNLQLVTEVACQLFMGGRAMARHSLNILLSVLKEMLNRQPENPEALQFMISQILQNAVSTPDMLKGIPGGPTVPLEQGLKNNVTVTGEMVPLRKSLTHVSQIVCLLADHASDLAKLPVTTLGMVARRSLVKNLIGATARFAKIKNQEAEGGGGDPDALKEALDSVIFDSKLGIPIGGTAKPISLVQLGGIVEKAVNHTNMAEIQKDIENVRVALGCETLVSDEELSMALLALRGRSGNLWQILIEPLLAEMKAQDETFLKIWNAASETETTSAVAAVKEVANQQLTGSFVAEPVDHSTIPWPGFATPLGPSVYRCKCGYVFGDPNEELTDDTVEVLRQKRNEHFQQVFGADFNGYPTTTSAHFPLHRAVQRVLTREEFKGEHARNENMEWAVAKYLQQRKKGNIHVKSIQEDICFAIDTYLEGREQGLREPKPDEAINFIDKATLERDLILKARLAPSATRGEWADRQRQ